VAIGIITGSGTHALPGLEHAEARVVETPFGAVPVSAGAWAGVEVVHVSRHGEGHARLSHQVQFQANAVALATAGATAVVGCTVCGGGDPAEPIPELVRGWRWSKPNSWRRRLIAERTVCAFRP